MSAGRTGPGRTSLNLAANVALIATLLVTASDAEARRRRAHRYARGNGAFANDIGLGLILGTPTGLSAEFRMSRQTSVDLAVGLDGINERGAFYAHLDYLVYLVDLARGGSVGIPLYLGVGGSLYDHENRDQDIHVAARVPIGLAIAFRRAPVQIFFELAARVLLVTADDHDHRRVGLSGALGFRIYF